MNSGCFIEIPVYISKRENNSGKLVEIDDAFVYKWKVLRVIQTIQKQMLIYFSQKIRLSAEI